MSQAAVGPLCQSLAFRQSPFWAVVNQSVYAFLLVNSEPKLGICSTVVHTWPLVSQILFEWDLDFLHWFSTLSSAT